MQGSVGHTWPGNTPQNVHTDRGQMEVLRRHPCRECCRERVRGHLPPVQRHELARLGGPVGMGWEPQEEGQRGTGNGRAAVLVVQEVAEHGVVCSAWPGIKLGLNFFMLDSRRVLPPASKVLGATHISNLDVAPF